MPGFITGLVSIQITTKQQAILVSLFKNAGRSVFGNIIEILLRFPFGSDTH